MQPEGPKVLVVIGHGRRRSLCHHLAAVVGDVLARRGAQIRIEDLLADGFDPVLRLPDDAPHALPEHGSSVAQRYQGDVAWMDALVVVHPVWWFGPPAILKGWVDQVLVDGVAIRQVPDGSPKPLLGGRHAVLIQTYNAARRIDRFIMRSMAGQFWRRAVFLSTGIRLLERIALYGVEGISAPELDKAGRKVEAAVDGLLSRGARGDHGESEAEG